MIFVPDASVAAKWFRRENHTDHAMVLLNAEASLHVPDFFFLEIDSLISKWSRRGMIGKGEDEEFRKTLAVYDLIVHSFLRVREDAFKTAIITRTSPYDCIYLALAMRLNCRMVTADTKFHHNISTSDFKGHMLWVEDIAS